MPYMVMSHVVTAVVPQGVPLLHHPQQDCLVNRAVSLVIIFWLQICLAGANPQTIDEEISLPTRGLESIKNHPGAKVWSIIKGDVKEISSAVLFCLAGLTPHAR